METSDFNKPDEISSISGREVHAGNSFRTPEDILDVLLELRGSLNELLVAAGVDPAKTRATARELNLDRNLVWRMTRVASADDILSVAPDIPAARHFSRLCEICRNRGVGLEPVARLAAAAQRFEDMVNNGLGDRETLEALAAGLEYQDVTQRQESARKMAFKGNSAIWGVKARLNFKASIQTPSRQAEDRLRTARVSGLVKVRRLRPVAWPLLSMHYYQDDGSLVPFSTHPLEKDIELGHDLPLVPQFCSDPLPRIELVKTSNGHRYDLPAGDIGNAGALTCVFGDIIEPELRRYQTETDQYMASMLDLVTPSEAVILDMFLHNDLEFATLPEALLLDRLSVEPGFNPGLDDQHKIPLSAGPMLLGNGVTGASTPLFPQYTELVKYAMEKLDSDPSDFRCYRLQLSFPPVPSAVVMRQMKKRA